MNEEQKKSRVPALSKGLDIIELLAHEQGGLTQKDLAARVNRSVSEVFRVLGELEERGYIARDSAGCYTLTLRLFELAYLHPPTKRLVSVAVGQMEKLANDIGMACHLVVHQGAQLIVVAQAQPDALLMGWNVRVGATFPFLHSYPSARTIAAYQFPESTPEILSIMTAGESPEVRRQLEKRLSTIREQGHELSRSAVVPGITDVSCPVLNYLDVAIAALTVPMVGDLHPEDRRIDAVVDALKRAAAGISRAVGGNPGQADGAEARD
ncbi:DNA-binding IclR family transcriptional regulator OS=Castellaniella defragrans OX=75697 GN=HNR28_001506 PE=4 SV=1 [Castellaniella defragrans]